MALKEIVALKFDTQAKFYYFDPCGTKYKKDEKVVVETSRGIELAYVYITNKKVDDSNFVSVLKPIIRKATDEDIKSFESNKLDALSSISVIKDKIKELELKLKFLGCSFTLDKSKLIVYFSAEERVDFRELVKQLASIIKTRIEMRQIGDRDAARQIGGLGPCGLEICCKSFLGDFSVINMKLAKKQNLSLNPQKISGLCHKLLCCIKYESEVYEELTKNIPKNGTKVKTVNGYETIISSNVLRQTVKVKDNEGIISNFHINDVKVVHGKNNK